MRNYRIFILLLLFVFARVLSHDVGPSAHAQASLKVSGTAVQSEAIGTVRNGAETHYHRIVTLAPVLAEWTEAILGKSETEKNLIAVSEYSIYPSFLKTKPTVGAYTQLNIEKIATLKPDLVIASAEYTRPEQIEQLKRLKLPLEILPGEKFSEMREWIQKLGKVLKSEKSGEEAAKRWTSEVNALAAKKKNPNESFFLEIQHDPLITIGGESFLNAAFLTIGYENIFASLVQAYPKVSKESVIRMNPKNVFVLDSTGDAKDSDPAVKDWQKFGLKPQILLGDDFARCSFALLKGLQKL